MTSKSTREENVQAVFDLKAGYTLGLADVEILKRVARMALAAMDSEPVGMFRKSAVGYTPSYHEDAVPLYRHAQPDPVVQCPFPCGWDKLNKLAIQDAELVARGLVEGELTTEAHRQAAISNNDRLLKVISSCRAAMLQHQPQNAQQNIPENIPGGLVEAVNNLLNNDGSRGCYDAMECGTAREKIELWLAQRQRWEEQRKANLSAGNSPVIPDGYVMVPKEPTDEMIAAAMNCDDVLFNSDESFCVQFGNIYEAMLAAAPQEVKGE
ncbi:TPA: hypothetical protein ACNP37_005305 [Raoultella ornithinolytica]